MYVHIRKIQIRKIKNLERLKILPPEFNRSECLKGNMEALIINFRAGTYLAVLCKEVLPQNEYVF